MTPTELILANAVIALAALIQAASGVGAGFILVPILAWINLALIPIPVIVASLSLTTVMLWRERQFVDRQHVPLIFAGMVPGALAGNWLLQSVASDQTGLVFALVILFAIGLTASGLRIPFNEGSCLITGGLTGAMAASSGFGAPPLAILYQEAGGARLRATLALLYTGASLILLVLLALVGDLDPGDLEAGILLMPGGLLGWAIVTRMRWQLDNHTTRPVVLTLSAAAAVALLIRSL